MSLVALLDRLFRSRPDTRRVSADTATSLPRYSELRADLNSQYRDARKEAIKRVIASMTVGKDVSGACPTPQQDRNTGRLSVPSTLVLTVHVAQDFSPMS